MVNLQRIKTIAKENKITLRDLATKTGITEQALHQLIRRNSTATDTLSKIANILEVDIKVFFESETETKQRISGNKVFLAFEIDKENEDKVVKMIMGKDFIKLIQSE